MKSVATRTRLGLSLLLVTIILTPATANARGGGHGGGHIGHAMSSHGMSSHSSSGHRASSVRSGSQHAMNAHLGHVSQHQPSFKKATGQGNFKKIAGQSNFKKPSGPISLKHNGGPISLAKLGTKKLAPKAGKLAALSGNKKLAPKTGKLIPLSAANGKGKLAAKPGKGKVAPGMMAHGHDGHHHHHGHDHWNWHWNGFGICDGGDCDADDDCAVATSELDSADPAEVADKPDLELLGVNLLDQGNAEELIGPRYRVTVRNSSTTPVSDEFAVTVLAGNDGQLSPGLPQNSKWVPGLDAGQVIAVDVRLPFAVTQMNVQPNGDRGAFSHLFVLVDSNNDVDESDETNNTGVMSEGETGPVDGLAIR